jgi:CubicO group peptidase (beta-lactamase class C family)
VTVLDTPIELAPVLAQIGKDAERLHIPGVQVAVVRDGSVLYAGGLGVARVEDRSPVGPRTLFHHGSCGKAYTSLLAVLLAEDGLLDLDSPMRAYVPELRLPDPVIAERATLRDLLSHRAGLGRHDPAWIFNPSWSREDMVRRLAHLPLAGDLRAQFVYSNFGYAVAGLAIGRVTGRSWEEELQSRVLNALGMTRAVIGPDAAKADPDHAEPYVVRDGTAVRTPWRQMPAAGPAGGVATSAEDAATWLLVQLGGGEVPRDVVAKTQQLHVPMPAVASPFPELQLTGYGLGWGVGAFRKHPLVWHTGGVDGFYTYTVLLPDDGIGVTVSANVFNVQLSMAAGLDIIDALLGVDTETSWVERMHPAAPEPAPPAPRTAESALPAHPLADHAGIYTHDGYGDVVVSVVDGALAVTVGEFEHDVRHRHFDTWDLRYSALDFEVPLTFFTAADGAVADVFIQFDEETGPIRFRKRRDEA